MKLRKKTKRADHSGSTTAWAKRSLPHALVGVWEQVPNRFHTTTVVYRIANERGTVCITAVDESDQSTLKISHIGLSGSELRFQSLYSPTKHKAFHTMRLTAKNRATHVVTYTDEDGRCVSRERWRKRTDTQWIKGEITDQVAGSQRIAVNPVEFSWNSANPYAASACLAFSVSGVPSISSTVYGGSAECTP
jgi:hypothetical protein